MNAAKPKSSSSNFVERLRHLAQALLQRLQNLGKFLRKAFKQIFKTLRRSFRRIGTFLRKSWQKFMRKFTRWIDPHLEKYRPISRPATVNLSTEEPKVRFSRQASPEDTPTERTIQTPIIAISSPKPISPSPEVPQTRADLLEIIQSAPLGIFDRHERELMAAALNLPTVQASEIMQPKSKIVYVKKDEVLGPLTLDRLYRSGFAHFPVKDERGDIIGAIHTTHLNNLDIRESSTAAEILDPGIYYIRADYSLEEVLNTFLRTNSYFFLVVDKFGSIIGILTFKDFCRYLFGERPHDSFERDNDNLAVAKRSLPLHVSNQPQTWPRRENN